MAKNAPTGDNRRVGAVRQRSQVYNPQNDRWTKRDTQTGRFMDQPPGLGRLASVARSSQSAQYP